MSLILGLFIYKTFFNINDTIVENKNTIIQIDTVFVTLPPDTVIKENIKYQYVKIDSTDYASLYLLNDSLQTLEMFIEELKLKLANNEIYTLYDSTTFESGDRIETEASFFPLNKITYKFFPGPTQMIIEHQTTTIYKDSKTWFSILPTVGIGATKLSTDITIALHVLTKKYLIGTYIQYNLQNGNTSKGINLGIRFNIIKPTLKTIIH